MTRRPLQAGTMILALAAAIAAGWFGSRAFTDEVSAGGGFDACFRIDGMSGQTDCLADRFSAGAKDATAGLDGAERDDRLIMYVRAAETLAQDDPRIAGTCHPAMHQLGRSEGRRAAVRDTVPAFPSASSQLCTAGYVHGLAEGYLVGTPEADVAAVFPALCHVTKAREGCAHGIGHALVQARADQSSEAAARGAMENCRDLPGEFPTNCFNGTFMELAMRREPRPISPNEFASACGSIPAIEDSLSCWGYMTLNLRTNDVDVAEAPRWCGRAELPGQYPCIEQFGRDIGVEGMGACVTASERVALQERCIDGAVGLQVGSGHVTDAEARRACQSLDDQSLARHCDRAVSRYAKGRRSVETA